MAAMNIQMSLTLEDAASGPLRVFADLLTRLQATAAKLSPQLEAAAKGINSIGTAAASASGVTALAAGLERLAPSLAATRAEATGAASGVTKLGAGATEATAGVAALSGASAGLVASLTRAVAALTAAAAGMTQLATAGQGAAQAGLAGAAGMNAMGVAASQANTHASSLSTTIKGMAKLWAAFEIEKGLKESASEAISYQSTQTRLKAMNIAPGDREAMIGAAEAASKAVPQFNNNETLSMLIDLRNATGSVAEAIHMIEPFAVAAYNMRAATPQGSTFKERDMLLIAKSLEQRNATMDPAKMQEELNMIERIYTATQGRVDATAILGNLQYSRGGLGQSLDIGFMPMFAAMIEQIRSAGGNGGQIGTGLTAMQRYVLGNTKNGTSAKEAAELGLIDSNKLVWNSQGNINLKKSDITMAGADEFQRNPYLWIQNYLKPAMIRAGIDLTNDAAVNKTLTALFPSGTANSTAAMMINRGPLLEKDAGNITQSLAGQAARAVNIDTAKANLDAFKAQIENLAIVMGTVLLPAITLVAKGFTATFEWLAAFFKEHPFAAEIATWGLAIGSVALAVAGFAALFGGLGLGAMFTAVGTAGVGMATGVAGALGLTLGPALLAAGALVAAFLAGWNFGSVIGSIEIFGKSVQEHMTDLIEWVVNSWVAAWDKIGSVLSGINAEARKSQAQAAVIRVGGVAGAGYEQFSGPEGIDMGKGDGWGGQSARSSLNAADAALRGTSVPKPLFASSRGASGEGGGGGSRAGRTPKAKIDKSWEDPMGDFIAGVDEKAKRDELALDKAAADFRRAEAKASGDRHQAELIHIQQQITENSKLLVEKGKITQAEVDAAIAHAQAASSLAYEQEELTKLQSDRRRNEQTINAEVENGIKTALEGANEKYAAGQLEAQQILAKIDLLRQLAAASGNPKSIAGVEDQYAAAKAQLQQLSPLMKDLKGVSDNAFKGFFSDILQGGKSAHDIFKSLFSTIKRGIDDIISKILTDMVTKFLLNSVAGGSQGALNGVLGGMSTGGGGMGGMFGSLLSSAGNAGGGWWNSLLSATGLSGSTYAFGSAAGAGATGAMDMGIGGLPGFAIGIDTVPRDMAAMIHKDEAVLNARDAADWRKGDSGNQRPIVNHNNFTLGAPESSATQSQIANRAAMGIMNAQRRHG